MNYLIHLKKSEDGRFYEASCNTFPGLPTIESCNAEDAITGLVELMTKEGAEMMLRGDTPPKETGYEDEMDILVSLDFEKVLHSEHNKIVRRTVSLPEWMDIMIRNSEIDSSSVFREAIRGKLLNNDPKESLRQLRFDVLESKMHEIADHYIDALDRI